MRLNIAQDWFNFRNRAFFIQLFFPGRNILSRTSECPKSFADFKDKLFPHPKTLPGWGQQFRLRARPERFDQSPHKNSRLLYYAKGRLRRSKLLWNVSCWWVPQITFYFLPFRPIQPILALADWLVCASLSGLREKRKKLLDRQAGLRKCACRNFQKMELNDSWSGTGLQRLLSQSAVPQLCLVAMNSLGWRLVTWWPYERKSEELWQLFFTKPRRYSWDNLQCLLYYGKCDLQQCGSICQTDYPICLTLVTWVI